jgi:hypothetical protein
MNAGSLVAINTPALEANTLIAAATSVSMIGASGSQVPLSWVADVDVASSPVADSEFKVYASHVRCGTIPVRVVPLEHPGPNGSADTRLHHR